MDGYYSVFADPSLVAPVPGNISKVLRSVEEEVARQKALNDIAIETGRQRELERQKAELFPIVTELEPGSEVSDAFWKGVAAKEYAHQFPMGERRAARREAKGLPGYREARAVPLFSPEDLSTMRDIQFQSAADRAAAAKAQADALFEARLPYEMSREYLGEEGYTKIEPGKGYEYSELERARALSEPYKAETGRINATRPRGGGGGGGAETEKEPSMLDRERFMDSYYGQYGQKGERIAQPVLTEEGKPIGREAQNRVNYYVRSLSTATPEEADDLMEEAEAEFGGWGRPNPDIDAALNHLRRARAGLYRLYGRAEEEGTEEEEVDWTKLLE